MDKVEQGDAKAVAICALIKWIEESWVDSPCTIKAPLTLPAMQRDGVWRPNQVLGLWRSVLAGMPIGRFYLQEGKADRDIVDITGGGRTTKAASTGLDLIDGQQRIRALALGVPGFNQERRCLWITFTDGGYELRLTSRAQPFGYGREGRRLSLDERRKAREAVEGDNPEESLRFVGRESPDKVYDSDLFEHRVEGKHGELPCPPLPFECKEENTVQLDLLLSAYMNRGEPAWREVVPKHVAPTALDALARGFENLSNRGAVLMVLKDSVLEGNGLSDFFRCVGAGGTPLSEAEQLFSAFKAVEPGLRTVVKDIQADVSAVFSPAQVMTAILRIANVRSTGNAVTNPGFDAALEAIRNKAPVQKTLAGELHKLVFGSDAPIRKAFREAKEMLTGGEAPFRLSDIVLAGLRPELWQVLAYWCLDHSVQEDSCKEATRFALFWKFGVNYPETAVRLCFRCLSELSDDTQAIFPARELYAKLVENGAAVGLADAKTLRATFTKGSDGSMWLTHAKRFTGNSKTVQTAIQWWYGAHMLEWSQRAYLKRAFEGFRPLTDHEDDIPYDKDHICAQAHWRHDGRSDQVQWHSASLDVRNAMREARDHLGNSIGNFRLIESLDNRSVGAALIKVKMSFWHKSENHEAVSTAADFCLGYPGAETEWMKADGEKLDWSQSRLRGFQAAVGSRTALLYEEFLSVFPHDWILPDDTATSFTQQDA